MDVPRGDGDIAHVFPIGGDNIQDRIQKLFAGFCRIGAADFTDGLHFFAGTFRLGEMLRFSFLRFADCLLRVDLDGLLHEDFRCGLDAAASVVVGKKFQPFLCGKFLHCYVLSNKYRNDMESFGLCCSESPVAANYEPVS